MMIRLLAKKNRVYSSQEYDALQDKYEQLQKQYETDKLKWQPRAKPQTFDKMREVFTDSAGMRYYTYINDADMSLDRIGAIKTAVEELHACLTHSELDEIVDAMDGLCARLLSPAKTDKPGSIFRGLQTLISEIKLRRKSLIREDILYKIAGIRFVREDEDPAVYDEEIARKKIKTFQEEAANGGAARDFFISTKLSEFMPFSDMSEQDYNKYLETTRERIARARPMIEAFISEAGSSNESKSLSDN